MSAIKQAGSTHKESSKQAPKPAVHTSDYQSQQQNHLTKLIRRVGQSPGSLAPRDVIQLQSVIGNQAVRRHIAGKTQEAQATNGKIPSVLRRATPSKSSSKQNCKVEIDGKVVADFQGFSSSVDSTENSPPSTKVRLLDGVVRSDGVSEWFIPAFKEGRQFNITLLVSDPRTKTNLRITLKNAIVDRWEFSKQRVKSGQFPIKELDLVCEKIDYHYR